MHDRGNITVEHKQEVMVTLSETVMENSVRRPYRRYHYDVISGLQENVIISETMQDVKLLCLKQCLIEVKLL
jgi:hypothetical protein